MKTIATLISLLISTTVLYAQYPPPPPPPPATTTTSTSSSYSMTESDGDGSNKNTNVSIAISNSDDSYTMRAKFPKDKYTEILDLLKVEMSSNNPTTSNSKYVWELDTGGDEVYKVSLTNTKLSMYLDKTNTSSNLTEKFVSMGQLIRAIITGNSTENRKAELLQRDADRLYEKADRMRKEAERLRKMAEKDSDRLYKEAMKLKGEADKAMNTASYNGSVSELTLELLKNGKTIYRQENQNNNWVWPLVQPELLELLSSKDLITSPDEVHFVKDETGVYVNGTQVRGSKTTAINSVLSTNGIVRNLFFKFDKKKHHIVLLDENASVENAFKELVSAGIIKASMREVSLEINGNSVLRNGEQLQHNEVSKVNAILLKNNIIPAPGKILAKNSKGYRLGYTVNRGAHYGTWVMM